MPVVNLSMLAGAGAQFFDNNGNPLSGGKLLTYAAGTTTPQVTYTTAAGNVAHTNPIVLDSAGRVPSGEIWLTDALGYKFTLTTSADVLIATYDNVTGNGSGILASLAAASGAGLVGFSQSATYPASTVGKKLQQIVCPLDAPYSAAGNGITNDAAALQAAINSNAPIIDLAGRSYLLNTKLTFSVAGQTVQNGTLIFNGDNTTRIGDVTANDVTFVNVTFDGNEKQPRSASIWVNDNVQRPKFHSCTFKNLTGRYYGTSALNGMYGVLISPYGVENFEFRDCLFQDFAKYNDGINTIPVTPAFVGGGFVGGVAFMPENLNPGSTAQTVVTQGTIEGCTFDNIQTIRAAGLTVSDQIEFNDADAIRTYGDANTPSLYVHVSDCVFNRVSKRCFKFRAEGSVAYDNECYATDLPYQMTSPIDLSSNSRVVNLKIQASVALPVYNAVTWSVGPVFNREALIQGLFVSHCENGINFFSDPSNGNLDNFIVRDCFFNQCNISGIVQSAPLPTNLRNIVIEDTQIYGAANNTAGLVIVGTVGAPSSISTGLKIDNVYISNADVYIGGTDNDVRNLTIEISSSTFAGRSSSAALFRIGETGAGGFQNVDNLFINAWNLNTSFLNATRQNLNSFIGDNGTFKNVRIKVPQALTVTYSHAEIYGREMNFDGLQYDGAGRIEFGTVAKLERSTILNATRMSSNGSACTEPFLYTSNAATTQVALMNITDLRPTTASSIVISAGTEFIVYNVASKTSNGTIVQNGGLAKTANINTF
jgi:hypothetical protein